MNRPIGSILLQGETAAPLRIVRIVFNHEGRRDPGDNIANPHCVRRQLLESVKRDSHLAAGDQRPDLLESATHGCRSSDHARRSQARVGKAGRQSVAHCRDA